MTNRNVLYRIYNADGELLYVGATTNPGGRLRDHALKQPWWDEAEAIRLERFDSLEALRAAETKAIDLEGPLYNIRPRTFIWATKPRRPRGDGGLYQRLDGVWMGVVELPPGADGKRRRKRVASRDRATALRKLEALKQSRALL